MGKASALSEDAGEQIRFTALRVIKFQGPVQLFRHPHNWQKQNTLC